MLLDLLNHNPILDKKIDNSLKKLFIDMGQLDLKQLYVEALLSEHRTVFSSISTVDVALAPRSLKSTLDYQHAYRVFVDCQSACQDAKSKLNELKALIAPLTSGLDSVIQFNSNLSPTSSKYEMTRLDGPPFHSRSLPKPGF